MSGEIKPVFTAEQWRHIRSSRGESAPTAVVVDSAAIAIAVNNDLLPDDDPRKITRERLALLRYALTTSDFGPERGPALDIIAALESYLPEHP